MTLTAASQLAAYRSNHVIELQQHGGEWRCAVDGLRVLPLRVHLGDPRRWRHDPSQIERLLKAQYGGPFGNPIRDAAVIDGLVQDGRLTRAEADELTQLVSGDARQAALEEGRLTFERSGLSADNGTICSLAGHVDGCPGKAGGDHELREGWIGYDDEWGNRIEVEVTGA